MESGFVRVRQQSGNDGGKNSRGGWGGRAGSWEWRVKSEEEWERGRWESEQEGGGVFAAPPNRPKKLER